jgi:hypothetical protein
MKGKQTMQYNRPSGSDLNDVQRLPRTIVILMIVVVLILVAGGGGLVYFSISGQAATHAQATATAQANTVATAAAATATTHAHATATTIANAHATTTSIANAHATATSVVNVQATATASAIAANPDPYPPGSGRLALFDALSNNSLGYNWSANPTNCVFTGGAYHVIAPDPRFFAYCTAQSTNFTNFAYEVQMKIIKGDLGGIIFRASTNNNFYLFYVTQLGSYELLLCPGNTCRQIVAITSSPAINRGLNSTNLVAVVVTGTTITLFVNHQQITSVIDSTFSHGQIGVVASPFANAGHPTEVVYSNARVWTL